MYLLQDMKADPLKKTERKKKKEKKKRKKKSICNRYCDGKVHASISQLAAVERQLLSTRRTAC